MRLIEHHDIRKTYTFHEAVGGGQYGQVRFATRHNIPDERLVVKSIPNKNHDLDDIAEELNILLTTDSPFVCKCFEIFFDAYYLHIVMENCQAGDIGRLLKKEGKFSEEKCALVIKQCLKGLSHLHDLNIVHRDMKPDNILCIDDICSEVKLCDFGLSKVLDNKEDK